MSTLGTEKSNQWNIYTSSSDPSSSQTEVVNNNNNNQDGEWKNYGSSTSSMNAISFGFVATAILISMFLIMAIFEHLFRPSESYSSSSSTSDPSTTTTTTTNRNMESTQLQKFRNPQTGSTTYSSNFSVLMPGQRLPTFIAKPAPLPCSRERVYWPSHQHNLPL